MLPDIVEIKRRRKVLGITQNQLSKDAHVSQSLIAKLESGKLEPSYSIAKNIFLVLDKLENKTSKKAKDYSSGKIIKVEAGEGVKAAISIMKRHDISQLPVFDGNSFVGSFSEKTVLDKIAEGGSIEDLEMERVSDVMGEPFPSINEDTPINSFVGLLQHNQALLVLRKGKPSGVITKSDLLKK